MSGPKEDYLYVMQAKDGRVKIGRSVNPELRRRQIQNQGGMQVYLLAAMPKRGDDEYDVQGELWQHVLIGEWVRNCQAMWELLNAFLGTNIEPRIKPKDAKPRVRGARTERRVLADGTVKEYFYPGSSAQKDKVTKITKM